MINKCNPSIHPSIGILRIKSTLWSKLKWFKVAFLLALKGHSQLCACADLDTSFFHFEKRLPQPEIKVHLEIRFVFGSVLLDFKHGLLLIFNRLPKNLFLSVLCSSNDIIFIMSC